MQTNLFERREEGGTHIPVSGKCLMDIRLSIALSCGNTLQWRLGVDPAVRSAGRPSRLPLSGFQAALVGAVNLSRYRVPRLRLARDPRRPRR